jgi:hypothetical protein
MNVTVKKEDQSNAIVLVEFKKLLEISIEEYLAVPAKSNWNGNIILCSFNQKVNL